MCVSASVVIPVLFLGILFLVFMLGLSYSVCSIFIFFLFHVIINFRYQFSNKIEKKGHGLVGKGGGLSMEGYGEG